LLLAGDVTSAELADAFAEQAAALAEGGADALLVETMSDLEEAALAVAAAQRTGLPVVASVVFDSGRDKDRTMMGATPEQAAAALTAAGADVIGANCGLGIEHFAPICRRLKAAAPQTPVWIKPNAGMPELVGSDAVYGTDAAAFASRVPELLEAGADFIGGCCGSTPEFIRALRQMLRPTPNTPNP
jgi:methionine synthase I (cobalamin-dependent)